MDKITTKQISKYDMPQRATKKEDRFISKPRMKDTLFWRWWRLDDERIPFLFWAGNNMNQNEKRCREEGVTW